MTKALPNQWGVSRIVFNYERFLVDEEGQPLRRYPRSRARSRVTRQPPGPVCCSVAGGGRLSSREPLRTAAHTQHSTHTFIFAFLRAGKYPVEMMEVTRRVEKVAGPGLLTACQPRATRRAGGRAGRPCGAAAASAHARLLASVGNRQARGDQVRIRVQARAQLLHLWLAGIMRAVCLVWCRACGVCSRTRLSRLTSVEIYTVYSTDVLHPE